MSLNEIPGSDPLSLMSLFNEPEIQNIQQQSRKQFFYCSLSIAFSYLVENIDYLIIHMFSSG